MYTDVLLRTRIFLFAVALSFLFLILGLFHAQIIQGQYYSQRSEQNRIVVIPLEAPRGRLVDRNGKVIVDNRISFDVSVIYKDAGDFGKLVTLLSDVLDMDSKKLLAIMEKAKWRPYAPTLLAEDIGKKNAIILEQLRVDYPGLVISTKPRREYVYGRSAASITGYLNKISEDELTRFKTYGFTADDLIGRSGLEKQYDNYLRGAEGGMQVEIDSVGRQKRILQVKYPETGNSVRLTVDIRLQQFCYEVMDDKHGAIIVMNPINGEIYSLMSKPSFDPNIFVNKGMNKEINRILVDREKEYPLLNRCISCGYPPGSIFKIVVGAAALETGSVSKDVQYACPGYLDFGGRRFKCWREEGHGVQYLGDALKNSCNVFFYKLGLRTGVDNISDYAAMFGLGTCTGIDLPGEIAGVRPSKKWKRAVIKESWYKGDTVNYSIGQGYLLVTPIQLIRVTAAVANGGFVVRPYLAEQVGFVKVASSSLEKINVSQETLHIIKEGLIRVVNDKHATGMKARLNEVVVAGKTGTAQNPKGGTHGWFSGFAPAEKPSICVLAFVEDGRGGLEASGIARSVMKKCIEIGLM